jgi:hypothetical protein
VPRIEQAELGTYPAPVQAVLPKLLEAASPGAQVPLHWRYSLMSLAVLLFILPPVDPASAQVTIVRSLGPERADG